MPLGREGLRQPTLARDTPAGSALRDGSTMGMRALFPLCAVRLSPIYSSFVAIRQVDPPSFWLDQQPAVSQSPPTRRRMNPVLQGREDRRVCGDLFGGTEFADLVKVCLDICRR